MDFHKKDLNKIVKGLIKKASHKKTMGATLITLSGDLGSGKTTLTKELGLLLGIQETMISPTFVIIKNYQIKNKEYPWKNLIHIDAYRLDKASELLNLGWAHLINNNDNLIILEWPEKVKECLVNITYQVKLEHQADEIRSIEISS